MKSDNLVITLLKALTALILLAIIVFGFYSYITEHRGTIRGNMDRYNQGFAYTDDPQERSKRAVSAKQARDNPWYAKFGNDKIFKSEVEEKLQMLFDGNLPNGAKSVDDLDKAMVESLVKNMVIERTVLEKARNTDIEHRSIFKQKLLSAKNELIQREYINDIMKNAATDAKINEEYQKMVKTMENKKEYRISHILVASQVDADRAFKELINGEPFGEIALKRSIDMTKDSKGELGWFEEGQMPLAIEEEIKKIKQGDFTKPVETKFGWHIVKLHESRAKVVPKMDELKEQIKARIGQEAVQDYISKIVDEAHIIYNF